MELVGTRDEVLADWDRACIGATVRILEEPATSSTTVGALRCGGRYINGCHPADDPVWDIEDELARRDLEAAATTQSTTFEQWHRETYGCEWWQGYICDD